MEVGEISGVREFLKVDILGHSCSTAVEHISCNQEVVGLNPAVGFFLLLHLLSFPTLNSGVSLIGSLKEVHLYLCVVKAIKMDA